jgi:hypothetical protein
MSLVLRAKLDQSLGKERQLALRCVPLVVFGSREPTILQCSIVLPEVRALTAREFASHIVLALDELAEARIKLQ